MIAKPIATEVENFLETWAPHCGAPAPVFEGQFRALLERIFDEVELRAEENIERTHKLEGMHYAALKEVRQEMGVPRRVLPPARRQERR